MEGEHMRCGRVKDVRTCVCYCAACAELPRSLPGHAQRDRVASPMLAVCAEVLRARGTTSPRGARCIAGHLAFAAVMTVRGKALCPLLALRQRVAQDRAQRCCVPPLHQRQDPQRTLHRVVKLRRRRCDGGQRQAELLREPRPCRLCRLHASGSETRCRTEAAQVRTGPPGTSL